MQSHGVGLVPKVYSYIRFSTAGQGDGNSEERQLAPALSYAVSVGLELDSTFRDLGISASSGKHRRVGHLAAFLREVEAGRISPGSHLVVEAFDRLNREPWIDASDLIMRFLRKGITIATLEDGQIYTKSNINNLPLIMNLVMKLTAAHEFSKRLQARIIPTKEKRLKIARENKKPMSKIAPGWLRVVDGEFEEIPERVATVRMVFDLALKGYGSPAIAQKLNQNRVPLFNRIGQGIAVGKSREAKSWSSASIAFMLTNEAVIGKFQPITKRTMHENADLNGKSFANGSPILDFYPVIIDIDIFHRVQNVRKTNVKGANRGISKPGSKLRNLLPGKIFCSHCGGTAILITSNNPKRTQLYLYCESALRKHGCTVKGTFDYRLLENMALEKIGHAETEGLFLHSAPSGAITALQEEYTSLTLTIQAGEKIMVDWMSSDASDRVKRLLALKEAELDQMEVRLKELRKQLDATSTADLQNNAMAVISLTNAAQNGDVDARLTLRTALRSIIARVEIDVMTKTAEVITNANGYRFEVEHVVPINWVCLKRHFLIEMINNWR